jgi:hypothetical protein
MAHFTCWEVPIEEQGPTYVADNDGASDEVRTPTPPQCAMPRKARFEQHPCSDMNGFGLHTEMHCGADERKPLEQLCRCTTPGDGQRASNETPLGKLEWA